MLKRIVIFIAAIIVLLIVACTLLVKFSKIPAPYSPQTQSYLWSKNGNYTVSTLEFKLRDKSRTTQKIQHPVQFSGLPYRDFETKVWFPKSQEKKRYPLIVYSHGFMSDRNDIDYINQALSSRGFIVLAANYPLTSRSTGDAVFMPDVVNQPDDISFLLNQIINSTTNIGQQFSHLIDTDKIGVMGYSLGGLTSTLAAYHPDKKDGRIKAVVSIAGPSAMLEKAFYQTNRIPFLMIAGTLDHVTPYDDHATVILDRIDNSALITIKGGSHMGFAEFSSYLRWSKNPDTLACSLMNSKMESMGLERHSNAEKGWYPLIGTRDQGVKYDDTSQACKSQSTVKKALNPLKQQTLTKIAVISFFEYVFSHTPEKRQEASMYLFNHLEKENKEIHFNHIDFIK